MAPEDSKAPFLRIPWAAALLKRPNTIWRAASCRVPKASTEDSLYAEILKTPRTLRSCLVFFPRPPPGQDRIPEINVLFTMGDGMNGYPHTLHGGIVATLLDESWGMLEAVNAEWRHMSAVAQGKAEGELAPHGVSKFTAELKVKYLRPVQTPGALMVTARGVKTEGRKAWMYAEIKQRENTEEDYDGDEVLCATGEALFIEPKPRASKL